MLVHEKGASLPLSTSTATNCASLSIALICALTRQRQSQQPRRAPGTSAILNLLIHFHHTNKQRGQLHSSHSLLLEVYHPPP